MSEFELSLKVPADQDGYVLFQCPLCGEFFKLRGDEYRSGDNFEIWCPTCGLKSDNYFTVEVIELAEKMVANAATDMIYNEFKKMERKHGRGVLTFKAGKKPEKEDENPIVARIDALEVQHYKCCNRSAKIKPGVKMNGSFCPYCGVSYDGAE
ncbi:MAG: TFIIB-type zinc ribbon-containing protein [Acetobacterium sp.]